MTYIIINVMVSCCFEGRTTFAWSDQEVPDLRRIHRHPGRRGGAVSKQSKKFSGSLMTQKCHLSVNSSNNDSRISPVAVQIHGMLRCHMRSV